MYTLSNNDDPTAAHVLLAEYGKQRLTPTEPTKDWQDEMRQTVRLAKLEEAFLSEERRNIAHLAAAAPTQPAEFVAWFEVLKEQGPGQDDPLFQWLADTASYDEMRWFIRQELVGEAGFDDLIALTQLRMPIEPKLEMARNYWDEMGRGRENAMHGPILTVLAQELDLQGGSEIEPVEEALALGNTLVGLAANRRYAFHSVGALGAVELTAPTRTKMVERGLQRLGLSDKGRLYYKMHTTVDVIHSRDWNEHVLVSLVAAEPRRARWIAEGALMRLNAGARCFDRYRAQFGLEGPRAHVRAAA